MAVFVTGNEELGDKLKRARMTRGLSVKEVAKRTKNPEHFIIDVEAGEGLMRPFRSDLYALAKVYGLDFDELMEFCQAD